MEPFGAVRQGQQNRRGRGRNRKSQNPLSRSFESNGPDVKIRGTPAHIAEKYISLARDAQSSGDPVLAENYLQHAEHYSRIIMAYREQMQQSGEGSTATASNACAGRTRVARAGTISARTTETTCSMRPVSRSRSLPGGPAASPVALAAAPARRLRQQSPRATLPARSWSLPGPQPDRDRNPDRERHNDRDRGDRQGREPCPPGPAPARAAPPEPPAEAARAGSRRAAATAAPTGTLPAAAATSSPNSCAVRCGAPQRGRNAGRQRQGRAFARLTRCRQSGRACS